MSNNNKENQNNNDNQSNKMTRREFCKKVGVGALGLTSFSYFLGSSSRKVSSQEIIKSKIPKRPIGNTGMEASVLALGGGSRFRELNFQQQKEYVERALNEGINYIDTAINYQTEPTWGRILEPYREQVIIATKTPKRDYDGVMSDVKKSLQNLRTDYLDIYLIHNLGGYNDSEIKDVEGGVKALQELKEQGVVKAIGFSSHGSRKLIREACEKFDIDVVLVTTNNPDNANFKPDIPQIVNSGVAVIAMKVMRQIEGQGPGSGGRNYYREVLELPISTAVISHRTIDVFEENLATAREFGK